MSLLKKVAIVIVAWVVCVLVYLEFFAKTRWRPRQSAHLVEIATPRLRSRARPVCSSLSSSGRERNGNLGGRGRQNRLSLL